MQPVLFGTAQRRLAGLYHPPASGYSPRAFLLCNPAGQEAIRVYRCYRELALRLSQAGAHVFRFDYSGCGDSWGDAADCSMAGWLHDIETAAMELLDTAATEQLSVIGFRMGGALACMASLSLPKVSRMILVDPVVSGESYVRSAEAAHRVMLEDPYRFPMSRTFDEAPGELLGFEMPDSLLDEIRRIDLFSCTPTGRCRVELITSSETDEHRELRDRWQESGINCGLTTVPSATSWDDGRMMEQTLIAPGLVAAVHEKAAL
jgi:uncharacterized protein